ncbi:hypothetical protein GDO78_020241 [Eleutherodactylus coqui]|uniref:Immunoglobulin V-set domain-containing protein n=1 Tax=Eleutherodactylus coqui TaxID=57060 RepID=A0A8J6E5W2_ELECQ|nr:hypothetical protein GDO78_020241 [Eleutherodactylus coqui]
MKTFLLLLISLACLSGVQSQRLFQSLDPVVIKPRSSHQLPCEGFDFPISGYWMSWTRETSDGRLTFTGEVDPSGSYTFYHDSFKGRFTISRDDSNNMLHLQMNDMKPEDTAKYYCARHTLIQDNV